MTAPATPIASRLRKNDDEAVLLAFLTVVTSDCFYDFDEENDKKGWGISVVGATEYARVRAELGRPIRFTTTGVHVGETVRNGERGMEAKVIARDVVGGSEGIGYVFEPHYIGKGTDRERQEYSDRIAVSKAKRNSILDLMPAWHIEAILKARTNIARDNDKRLSRIIRERRDELRTQLARRPVETTSAPIVATSAAEMAAANRAGMDAYGTDEPASGGSQ